MLTKRANMGGILLSAAIVFAGILSIDSAYAATDEHPSPLLQLKNGVALDAVQCNEPRELYIRNSDTPVCIIQSTYELLLGYGMDLTYPTLGGLISSISEAEPSEVQQIVDATIRMYNLDTGNAFANIDALSETPVLHYPLVLNPDTGEIVAHGANPDRVGTQSAILGDRAVNPPEEIIAELKTGVGVWAEYTFLNPLTDQDQFKRSWLKMHDGYVFAAGYYY